MKQQKKLEEIFHIRKEIQDLEDRTSKIEKQSTMVADTVQKGYKHRAVIYRCRCKKSIQITK